MYGQGPYGHSYQQHHAPPPAGGQPGAYGAPPQQYGNPRYGAPAQQYGAPPAQYGTPGQQYGIPAGQYGAPNQSYGAPSGQTQRYGAPTGPPYGQPGGYGQPQGHAFPGGGYNAPQGPPAGVAPDVWGWFQAVDSDRSGQINAIELQSALHNNNWSHFNAETCRLMIGMFDKNGNGQIDVHEFSALWKYVQDWKRCFDGFDRDRSGSIDWNELNQAFQTFGYNLSPQFCQLCVRVFDRSSRATMKLDDFIQCCVMLKTLTDKFRTKDSQQKGVININYEDFLEMVLDTTLART